MTTDELNAKLAELHAAALAKGYGAAHVEIMSAVDGNGLTVKTWLHVLVKTPLGFKSAREPESGRGLCSVEDAVARLAQSVASLPHAYTAADLAPWFDPQHEINQVRA